MSGYAMKVSVSPLNSCIVSLPLCCLLLLSMASFSESPPTSSSCIFCFVHSKQSQGCLFSNWLHLFCLGLFHSIYQQNESNTWIVYCQLNELGKQWDWWGLTKIFTCFNVFWLLKMRLNTMCWPTDIQPNELIPKLPINCPGEASNYPLALISCCYHFLLTFPKTGLHKMVFQISMLLLDYIMYVAFCKHIVWSEMRRHWKHYMKHELLKKVFLFIYTCRYVCMYEYTHWKNIL